jgi:uncharacterized protein
MANVTLMNWGPISFQVFPLNFHEADQYTTTDWAKKEIAGAAIYREWTGEGDEELHLRGRLFPYRIGGLPQVDVMETQRRSGTAGLMARGDGYILGWFVCERLVRLHTFIAPTGVGKVINFEALFARVPTPDGTNEFSVLWKSIP